MFNTLQFAITHTPNYSIWNSLRQDFFNLKHLYIMLRILYLIAFAYTFVACGGDATTASNDQHNHEHHEGHDHNHAGHDHDHDHDHDHASAEGDGVHYGLEINTDGSMGLTETLGKVDAGENSIELKVSDDQTVKAIPAKVEGTVSEVCKKAGCWLKIANEDGKEIFITTNHEFFVPVDIVGKTVVVDGNAYKSVTSVEELRHYAEDDNQPAEEIAKITEPLEEYKLLAKGLMIKS